LLTNFQRLYSHLGRSQYSNCGFPVDKNRESFYLTPFDDKRRPKIR